MRFWIFDRYLCTNLLIKQVNQICLSSIISRIVKGFTDKDFMVGGLVDIEGAFDNTGFEVITNALRWRGVPNIVIQWIGNILKSRIKMHFNLVQFNIKNSSKIWYWYAKFIFWFLLIQSCSLYLKKPCSIIVFVIVY